jgi:hypothetical protein
MKISRKSPFSGETNVMDIDVTREQILDWEAGELIQYGMPNLTSEEREFIMTGITADEWEANVKNREDYTMAQVEHKKTGKRQNLTLKQFNRFFDNRDPNEWLVLVEPKETV